MTVRDIIAGVSLQYIGFSKSRAHSSIGGRIERPKGLRSSEEYGSLTEVSRSDSIFEIEFTK